MTERPPHSPRAPAAVPVSLAACAPGAMPVPTPGRTITVNGVKRFREGGPLLELLRAEGIDAERPGIAVAVNGEVVPRAKWLERRIAPGDVVEIVGAVAGG